jgi:hypothetical protein
MHTLTDVNFARRQVPAPFRWEVPSVFVLEPMEATIPVGGTQTMRVSIVPKEASVFVCRRANRLYIHASPWFCAGGEWAERVGTVLPSTQQHTTRASVLSSLPMPSLPNATVRCATWVRESTP